MYFLWIIEYNTLHITIKNWQWDMSSQASEVCPLFHFLFSTLHLDCYQNGECVSSFLSIPSSLSPARECDQWRDGIFSFKPYQVLSDTPSALPPLFSWSNELSLRFSHAPSPLSDRRDSVPNEDTISVTSNHPLFPLSLLDRVSHIDRRARH